MCLLFALSIFYTLCTPSHLFFARINIRKKRKEEGWARTRKYIQWTLQLLIFLNGKMLLTLSHSLLPYRRLCLCRMLTFDTYLNYLKLSILLLLLLRNLCWCYWFYVLLRISTKWRKKKFIFTFYHRFNNLKSLKNARSEGGRRESKKKDSEMEYFEKWFLMLQSCAMYNNIEWRWLCWIVFFENVLKMKTKLTNF